MSVVEVTLFCKPIELKSTTVVLYAILNNLIIETNIEWKSFVGICSDGALLENLRDFKVNKYLSNRYFQCVFGYIVRSTEKLWHPKKFLVI